MIVFRLLLEENEIGSILEALGSEEHHLIFYLSSRLGCCDCVEQFHLILLQCLFIPCVAKHFMVILGGRFMKTIVFVLYF
ncbi:hypothetical protein HanHA300_Chr09g0335161 [Helianthus annuus]|nr:hypothetical protein HanHA300_Chr09g0335161 [Helianthus annuus]KAJ0543953.1 hypothetical protein HanHA89_Chr09g0356201 [Helianthus annuus]